MTDKNYEEEYRKKLEEVARFPDMNPGPVLRLDFEGRVLLSNAAAQNLFGQDLHGRNWKNICIEITVETWANITSTDKIIPVEASIGEKCFLFNHHTDFASKLVFIFGSDVTALKNAEREVREIARFPDMNPGPVIRMDIEGKILLFNAAARNVFGEDLQGKNWLDTWPALRGEQWNKIISSENISPVEVRINNCDYVFNHRRDLQTDLVFVFGTDITIQKKAERQLSQTEKMATLGTLAAGIAHELNNPAAAVSSSGQQAEILLIKSEQWRSKLQGKNLSEKDTKLISLFSQKANEALLSPKKVSSLEFSKREIAIEDWLLENEIKNPNEFASWIVYMGIDLNYLRELSLQYDREMFFTILIWSAHQFQVHSLLLELKEASGRISEIVKAMKSYSFLDKAPIQQVDVHEGINNTLVILRSKLKSGVSINRDYGNIPGITAYGSELNQVWTNIIDNAIDAMKGKGEITIRTRSENGFVVVEIEDNGPGIPKEIQSRIFDPFFTTKEPGRGTGLGLSTTYGIITEKHKGSVHVQSEPGKTIFIINLPVNGIR